MCLARRDLWIRERKNENHRDWNRLCGSGNRYLSGRSQHHEVLCLDVDERKIAILQSGGIPIFEPGLEDMVKRNVEAGRLRFTTGVQDASVEFGEIQFIAVGTPPDEDGSADLQYVVAAARNIGRAMCGFKLVVNKSTVPVGTGDRVKAPFVGEELRSRGVDIEYCVASNPNSSRKGRQLKTS